MASDVLAGGVASLWDVARPARASRLEGVDMAGFRDRTADGLDMRVVPHPALTIVIEFGEGPLLVDDATGGRGLGSLAAGLLPGPTRVRGDGIECVEVRLSPVAAYSLLGTSPADLGGPVIDLEDLWGRDTSRLREQLAEVSSWQARFAIVDDFLAERHGSAPSVHAEVAMSWARILASQGRARVDDLAAACGWSRKRLWARFSSQIGLTPKRAAMLVRFDHAANRLAAGQDAARVAAECGYVDQSHLHRDVVSFAGCTPATIAAEPWLVVDEDAWPPATAAGRPPGTFVQDAVA